MKALSYLAAFALLSAVFTVPMVASAHPKHALKHHHDQQTAAITPKRHHHARVAQDKPAHKTRAERLHDERLAKIQALHHEARLVKMQAAQHARHETRLAKMQHRHPEAASTHDARLAKHYANLAQHYARLAKIQAKQQAHLAHLHAQHAAALAAHNARLAKIQAKWHARRDALARAAQPHAIRDWETSAYNVPIKVITVDLNDPSIRVSGLLAHGGIGSAEPFTQMIRRNQPDVAVTGTFFSLDNLHPVGDIVLNGGLAYFGGMGTALCITSDNRADMITVPWGHHHDWSGYDFVMACGPRLLESGRVVLDPHAEHFKDKHMLSPNSRIGVGITRGNKLVFVMTKKRIYLGRLAKVMRAVGCFEAMNLDAGTSTGFYCNGRLMARPGRWLTNAIVVHEHPRATQRASLM